MTLYISVELRKQLYADAGRHCGYCLSPERLTGMPLEVEHLWPVSAGGLTIRDNLWLSCHRCNLHKGDRTQALDPQSKQMVALFNPRLQNWFDHFNWSPDGTLILGQTEVGRATVITLQLNNPHVIEARYFWVEAGWWPPQH